MVKRIKQFTEEEIEILLQNTNLEEVTINTMKYSSGFKNLPYKKVMKVYLQMRYLKNPVLT